MSDEWNSYAHTKDNLANLRFLLAKANWLKEEDSYPGQLLTAPNRSKKMKENNANIVCHGCANLECKIFLEWVSRKNQNKSIF